MKTFPGHMSPQKQKNVLHKYILWKENYYFYYLIFYYIALYNIHTILSILLYKNNFIILYFEYNFFLLIKG